MAKSTEVSKPVVSLSLYNENAKRIIAANDCLRLQTVSWISAVSTQLAIVKQAVSTETFEVWVQENFKWTGRYANKILQARSVLNVFEKHKDIAFMPDNISQLCELAKIESDDKKVQAWKSVVSSGREITAKTVNEVVVTFLPAKQESPKRNDSKTVDGKVTSVAIDANNSESESPTSVTIHVPPELDVGKICREVERERNENPPVIQPMPMFESDEDTFKRLAERFGSERSQLLLVELFGPMAGANASFVANASDDAAVSPPPAEEDGFSLCSSCVDPVQASTNIFERCDKKQKKLVLENIKKLFDKSQKSSPFADGFEEFWEAFPVVRKNGKALAYKAWEKAVATLRTIDPWPHDGFTVEEFLTKRSKDYASSGVGNSEFAKGPAPWLNQGCWDDPDGSWEKNSKGGFDQLGGIHESRKSFKRGDF